MKRTIIVPDDQVWYKGVTRELRSPTQKNNLLTYTPGTVVRATACDNDASTACGEGINFCRSLAEALKWARGGTVITLVPIGTIVDTGAKLRAKAVRVLAIADLRYANLVYADLWAASLTGANLSSANLKDANLGGANLRGADLGYADLRGANLRGADLRYADLRYADLWGADLGYADLWGATGNRNTTLPVGYEVSSSGLVVRVAS